MSFQDAVRLLRHHWKLCVFLPLLLAISCYFFMGRLKKTFTSDTTIYTGIMSGYTLKGNAETDYYASGNAFDNLLNLVTSRATKEEAIFRLLAHHLHQRVPPTALTELLPADLRKRLRGATPDATAQRIAVYAHRSTTNEIYRLLNSLEPTYSLDALSHLTSTRLGTSDLIKLEYEANDPEVCRHTLQLVTEVFLDKSRQLHEGQTTSVVSYYEVAARKAKARLDSAERALLAFNRSNNIINYEAQSKNVAAEKEALNGEAGAVELQYTAAQSTLQALSRKLAGRNQTVLTSNNVLAQRQKLAQINAALADQELFAQQNPGTNEAKIAQLRAESDRTAEAIRNSVTAYYDRTTSTNGLASKDLLNEWMQNLLVVESSRAKLSVLNKRKYQFDREYQRMAPLGASLKRIEREIELAEKAYLAVVNSLNESQATQQNSELTANLKIVDPPNLPLKPSKSKRMVLTLLSLVGGFTLTAGTVLGAGLLDRTLRRPATAAVVTGLPVTGILPLSLPGSGPTTTEQRSAEQLIRHVLLRSGSTARGVGTPSFAVGVLSTRRGQGKTALCQALAQQGAQLGLETLTLYPEGDAATAPNHPRTRSYHAASAAVQGWRLTDLTPDPQPQARLLLIEFPALLEAPYPVAVLPQLQLIFLIASADQGWHEADRKAVTDLRAATTAPIELILSHARLEDANEFLGVSGKS